MSSPAVATGKIPKPEMRRLFQSAAKRGIIQATIFASVSVLLWKVFVTDVKKQKYAEFYANYDVEKENRRLIECGVFTAVKE